MILFLDFMHFSINIRGPKTKVWGKLFEIVSIWQSSMFDSARSLVMITYKEMRGAIIDSKNNLVKKTE
jgi:hypothetical protein